MVVVLRTTRAAPSRPAAPHPTDSTRSFLLLKGLSAVHNQYDISNMDLRCLQRLPLYRLSFARSILRQRRPIVPARVAPIATYTIPKVGNEVNVYEQPLL